MEQYLKDQLAAIESIANSLETISGSYATSTGDGRTARFSDYADIATMISTIGSASMTVLGDTTFTLSANTTLPATMHVVMLQEGMIVKASSYTLTINGPFSCGNFQCFSGFSSGDITGLSESRPEWWGGKADASTHSGVAIQSAASALTNGGILYLSAGEYEQDTACTISAAAITIQGAGKDITVVKAHANDIDGFIVAHDNCTIRDLTVDGYSKTGSTEVHGIRITGYDGTLIENVRSINGTDSGIRIGYTSSGTVWSSNTRIINCDVEDCRIGIESSHAYDVTLIGCHTEDTTSHGIRMGGIRWQAIGCTTKNYGLTSAAGYGFYVGGGGDGAAMTYDNTDGQIIGCKAYGSATATGKNAIWIGDNTDNLLIADTDLCLDDSAAGVGILLQALTAYADYSAKHVRIRNVHIYGDHYRSIAIQANNEDITIEGCSFRDFSNVGVRLNGDTSADVNQIRVNNNQFIPASGTTYCIRNYDCSDSEALGNTFITSSHTIYGGGSQLKVAQGGFSIDVTRSSDAMLWDSGFAAAGLVSTGQTCTFTTTGTLPSGLSTSTTYYIIPNSTTGVKVASSLSNAIAGTAVTLSDAGSGTHTLVVNNTRFGNTIVRP